MASDRRKPNPPPPRARGLVFVVFALTWVTFLPCLRNGFVSLDDPSYVWHNPHVQEGFTYHSLKWAWTSTESSNWHPVAWMSHLADEAAFPVESRRASRHERFAACDQPAIAPVPVVATVDRRTLAKLRGGGFVWIASIARGVSRMGIGKKRMFSARASGCSRFGLHHDTRKSSRPKVPAGKELMRLRSRFSRLG